MLKQTWPQMVISQCGPPAILASHPFREERGKNGAPPFVCDLELRVGVLGWPGRFCAQNFTTHKSGCPCAGTGRSRVCLRVDGNNHFFE